jgi:hypothetical protein
VSFVVQQWFFRLAAAFLELVNHAIEIRVAGAKASGEPVAAAFCYSLAIGQHVKLASLSRRNHGVNAQPLFDHGCETRGLGFVALSRRAGMDLNLHSSSRFFPVFVSGEFCALPMFRLPDFPISRFFIISVISVNQW